MFRSFDNYLQRRRFRTTVEWYTLCATSLVHILLNSTMVRSVVYPSVGYRSLLLIETVYDFQVCLILLPRFSLYGQNPTDLYSLPYFYIWWKTWECHISAASYTTYKCSLVLSFQGYKLCSLFSRMINYFSIFSHWIKFEVHVLSVF